MPPPPPATPALFLTARRAAASSPLARDSDNALPPERMHAQRPTMPPLSPRFRRVVANAHVSDAAGSCPQRGAPNSRTGPRATSARRAGEMPARLSASSPSKEEGVCDVYMRRRVQSRAVSLFSSPRQVAAALEAARELLHRDTQTLAARRKAHAQVGREVRGGRLGGDAGYNASGVCISVTPGCPRTITGPRSCRSGSAAADCRGQWLRSVRSPRCDWPGFSCLSQPAGRG